MDVDSRECVNVSHQST